MGPKARILPYCILILISSSAAYAHPEPMIEYSVVRGDTLIGICTQYLEYPGKWREIANINGMRNPERIHPGLVVRIPVRLLRGIPLEGEVTFKKGEMSRVKPLGESGYPLDSVEGFLRGL